MASPVNPVVNAVSAVRITTSGGEGILILRGGKGLTIAAGIVTDADCAYVQFDEDGKFAWVARKGGSMVKVAGKNVPCEVMQDVGPPALP